MPAVAVPDARRLRGFCADRPARDRASVRQGASARTKTAPASRLTRPDGREVPVGDAGHPAPVQRGDLDGEQRQRVAVRARQRAAAVPGDAVASRDVDDVDGNAEVLLEEHGHLARDPVGAAARRPGAHEQDGRVGETLRAAARTESEGEDDGKRARPHVDAQGSANATYVPPLGAPHLPPPAAMTTNCLPPAIVHGGRGVAGGGQRRLPEQLPVALVEGAELVVVVGRADEEEPAGRDHRAAVVLAAGACEPRALGNSPSGICQAMSPRLRSIAVSVPQGGVRAGKPSGSVKRMSPSSVWRTS